MPKDPSFAARMLRRNPSFAILATLSLALDIGAKTAVFSVADGRRSRVRASA